MKIRIDRFLDTHLSPAIDAHASENVTIVVVAHGIILNVLVRALLARFPTGTPISPADYLAAWSNTGVLQAKVGPSNNTTRAAAHEEGSPASESTQRPGLTFVIQSTNNVDHLQGLKKTRGGIGSAKFDSRQRTMDSFFTPASKKRKLEDKD
jgi:2,3-bisphosphoglycerate-dependent phosphoglycerate mutase